MMFATNNPAKAMTLASQYAAANPNRPAAHFIYASALATTKKFNQAIQEYQKVIQLDPKSVMSYIHIGQIYEITDRPDDALVGLSEGAANSAELAPGQQLPGESYVHKGDLKSAGKYFQAALNQNAHDPIAANNLAWVYAAEGENLDMALSLATQAKQIAPDLDGINDTLAWIQYKKRNYHVSIALAEDAVKESAAESGLSLPPGHGVRAAGEP